MFESLKYQRRLRKLFEEQARIKRLSEKEIKEARKGGKSHQELEDIRHMKNFELDQIDEEIAALVTTQLRNTANRLLVPIPDLNDEAFWIELNTLARMALTPVGISELRSAIRKERKERLANLAFWVNIILGLIGSITGLIAVLKN